MAVIRGGVAFNGQVIQVNGHTAPEEDRNALREITATLSAQTQDTGWDLGELDIPVERP